MTRAIFKSWFMDFDPIPGFGPHKEWQDSPLGKIPKGWRVGRLDDLLLMQRGFDLPSDQRLPGFYPVISASGLSGTHSEYKVKGPGVTTGRSGLIGKVFFIQDDFWPLNTSLWVKEFRIARPIYAYHLLGNIDFELFNAGSAVPTLNRNHVHNLPVVIPPVSIIERFDEIAKPLFDSCHKNHPQTKPLAATRDALLPKLLSGEIRVKDAGRFVEKTI
jgi:type I restriction enzyme, S subunit